jgi:asparagine synthetase B (glutamine-hydrolysing)
VQFHPEVTHTKQGGALLKRFITEICGCQTLWTAANIIDDQIARVREQVGDDHVLLGLSGGVDSSVVAALAASRDRRSAHLRVRRYRPAALEGRRSGDGHHGR